MLDRPRSGERALLLHVGIGRHCDADEVEEFRALARSAGASVECEINAAVDVARPRYFVGSGKAEEIAAAVLEHCAELVLVNRALTPSQERNLERLVRARVFDRNTLILDIFAQRAWSFEGQLQVELAQLEHLSTRLVRGWTHLERQKGGIGLRGPGESQLETDRRLVGLRIKRLKTRLGRVERQREVGRRVRQRSDTPAVALVGYTNAGKTTLFNALCGAGLEARDMLFATLDPTVRKLPLPGADDALVVDTVGFVRDLPHELVAAFRATLTETRQAALLLHVIDASDPHHRDRIAHVEDVLEEIGAADVPVLYVYNKIDRAKAAAQIDSGSLECERIAVSARTGLGVPALLEAIDAFVGGRRIVGRLKLGPAQSRIRAKLFEWHAVRDEEFDGTGACTLQVDLTARRWRELCRREGLSEESVLEEVC
ncbi:MAG TPA: ribosome rescue GTPase HflX [Gammaproteobacteria bacterium]|nr:ribosome rescue GTPase HflX [Gammaproteobacteria bacterium]